MRALPWILGGGAGALFAYYWSRRDRDSSNAGRDDQPAAPGAAAGSAPGSSSSSATSGTNPPTEPLPGRWVWPVGVWQGRKPEISSGFSDKRTLPSGQVVTHGGVDIMYRRQPADTWRPGARSASGAINATDRWVMPDHRAALAASDGVVSTAANTLRGWTVVIDHAPRKLATYYTHMSSLLVTPKQQVTAGTPLGIIGADPLDGGHLMHLHYEVWRSGYSSHFDPEKLMKASWEYLPDPGDLPLPLVARNAGTPNRLFSVPVQAHYRRLPRR